MVKEVREDIETRLRTKVTIKKKIGAINAVTVMIRTVALRKEKGAITVIESVILRWFAGKNRIKGSVG